MQTMYFLDKKQPRRKGAVLVLSLFMMIFVFAFVAFTIDVGYMAITKGELQNAADAASLAGVADLKDGEAAARSTAKSIAAENRAAGLPVLVPDADVLIGRFNFTTKTFTETSTGANAVRVITRVDDRPFFFAPILGQRQFDSRAESTAMLNPRDIVFVIDTSGSMNDDTEPQWATRTINGAYAASGYPSVATPLIQNLFTDLNFGSYPGAQEHIGLPLGVPLDGYAYAEMTKDDGALADSTIPAQYRIYPADDELVRKTKAYSWIIDQQIARLMPNARPIPNSTTSYLYWEKYIDYVISTAAVGIAPPPDDDDDDGGGGDDDDGGGGGGGGGPTPPIGIFRSGSPWNASMPSNSALVNSISPSRREHRIYASYGVVAPLLSSTASLVSSYVPYTSNGSMPGVPRLGSSVQVYLPANYDGDNFWGYNNPNMFTFPSPDWTDMGAGQNQIGYLTYTQFMLDFGRDRSPDVENWNGNAQEGVGTKTQLSTLSSYCAYHDEATAGGTFSFPPRAQPMHACRRALIAAMQVVKTRNVGLSAGAGDRVAIITFDALDDDHVPQLVQSLTGNYTQAMESCTMLQAVSDVGASTAIEAGLIAARAHLKLPTEGGQGRSFAKKMIVLLTDGVPNAWESSSSQIDSYITLHPHADYYASDYVWLNSALMQAAVIEDANTVLYCVGIGLGTDYDFMDRMSRMAGTDKSGLSPRGSGNPAEYEQRLTDIFEEIILNPGGRMVQ